MVYNLIGNVNKRGFDMKKMIVYTVLLTGIIVAMLTNSKIWATTMESPASVTPNSTTIIISKPPHTHPPQNFFVCYNRVTKYVTRDARIERCNPYGACREIIIPVTRKITSFRNCQINNQGCYGGLSKFGWYSSGHEAQQALAACHNQPIIVSRTHP